LEATVINRTSSWNAQKREAVSCPATSDRGSRIIWSSPKGKKGGMDKFAKQQYKLARTSTNREETPVNNFPRYGRIQISCWAENQKRQK
jgi:hypothetical protein